MAKVLYFTKGVTPTAAETTAIARLKALGHTVQIRDGAQSAKYGDNLEACDGVAGTIPSAYSAKDDYTRAPVAKPEAFKVFPAAATIAAAGTLDLRAISADLDESTGAIALSDLAKDAKVAWASADDTKCTVDTDGVVTNVAAGGPTNVTATYTSVAAAKAALDCGQVPTKQLDTVLEAHTAGVDGNTLSVELVVAAVAGAAVADRKLTLSYVPGTTTVGDLETAVGNLAGGDDLIDVKTAGTSARVLDANAAFPAQALTGGAAAVTDTATCAVTTS